MFDFLVSLFGGIFYSGRALGDASNKKRKEEDRAQTEEYKLSVSDDYYATKQLAEEVELYIKQNFGDLLNEFHDDLVYIYGENYMTDRFDRKKTKDWYYSIPASLKHLILARDYKKMVWYNYNTGVTNEQTPYSLRLFKRINEYIGDPRCQLTRRPAYGCTTTLRWYACGYYMPAINNMYSRYPESTMEYWSKYC